MLIEKNKSLRAFNTFGIDARAHEFISVDTVAELRDILFKYRRKDLFILGGGSNILISQDIRSTVLHINIKGKSIIEKDQEKALVQAMAGENWHQFVAWCLDNDLGGLENLSLIPGNCGTAPIQNIGAYGVELKDRFVSCSAIEIASGKLVEFSGHECGFGYRQSIFKNRHKGKFVIVSIVLELSTANHRLNTSYGTIKEVLYSRGIAQPDIRDVANAVIQIRQSKLPDPAELGNSGSFFKNPVVPSSFFKKFISSFPEAPYYRQEDHKFKIPAGWLIEQAGFKGKRRGDAGVHQKQALVLVNYGKASGREIISLSKEIQEVVLSKFGIQLEPEVNII